MPETHVVQLPRKSIQKGVGFIFHMLLDDQPQKIQNSIVGQPVIWKHQ